MNQYAWFTIFGFVANFGSFWAFNYFSKFQSWLLRHPAKTLLVIVLIYLLYAFLLPGAVNDVALFESVGYYVRQGIDFYWIDSSHGTYPFLPLMIPYYMVANTISQAIPIVSFTFLLKLSLIPIVYLVARVMPNPKASIGLLLSPPLFSAVVYHGQIDIVLIAFMILAINHTHRAVLSGWFYGLSILTKTWSVIFWPLWLRLKPKAFLTHVASAMTIIFAIVFVYTRSVGSSFTTVLKAATSHPGSSLGHWGITALFKTAIPLLSTHQAVYLASIMFFTHMVLWLKKVPVLRSVKIILLVLAASALGWGLQYSLWLVPFAYLDRDFANVRLWALLSAPFLAVSYLSSSLSYNLDEVSKFLSLFPWAYAIWWLAGIIRPRTKMLP